MQTRFRTLRFGIRLLGALALVSIAALLLLKASLDGGASQAAARPPPLILHFTRVFGAPPKLADFCPLKTRCALTDDQQAFERADAIVFHAADIEAAFAALPQSVRSAFRQPANERQRFVFLSQEAPPSLAVASQRRWWRECERRRRVFFAL